MIPKVIHLCWLSGEPYPELIQNCLASWARILPDYEVRLWDASSIAEDFPPWVTQAASRRKFGFAADFIRLHALYKYGGIYLDADVEVTQSFHPFLHLTSFMGRETGGDLEPAIIGAVAGTPWVGKCLDHYRDRSFILPNGDMDTQPLPIVVQEALQSNYDIDLSDYNNIQEFRNLGLTVFPAEYFSPKNRFNGKIDISRNTFSIHHFDGQWVEKGFTFHLKNTIHSLLINILGNDKYISIRNRYRNINQ